MLSENERQLLTTYADGEMSTRQRKAVMRLLRRSEEARVLLRQLQSDSQELAALPRSRPTVDFSDRLVKTIQQHALRPTPQRVHSAAVPIWSIVVAAASVLVAVGLSSFFYFSGSLSPSAPTTAHKDSPKDPPEQQPPIPPDSLVTPSPNLKKPDQSPPDRDKDGTKLPKETVVEGPKEQNPPTPPDRQPEKSNPDGIRVAPHMERFEPGSADVALPVLFQLHALHLEKPQKYLRQELAAQDAFYIELIGREGSLALPRVQSALKELGIHLVIDRLAQERQQKPQLKTNYLFYTNELTREDLAQLFHRIAAEDSKKDTKGRANPQFALNEPNLILCRLTSMHRKKLAAYLGVDPRQTSAAEPTEKSKQGPERLAVAVAYDPVGAFPQSLEVKRYLENRKPPRTGTVQVMLVLRGKP